MIQHIIQTCLHTCIRRLIHILCNSKKVETIQMSIREMKKNIYIQGNTIEQLKDNQKVLLGEKTWKIEYDTFM